MRPKLFKSSFINIGECEQIKPKSFTLPITFNISIKRASAVILYFQMKYRSRWAYPFSRLTQKRRLEINIQANRATIVGSWKVSHFLPASFPFIALLSPLKRHPRNVLAARLLLALLQGSLHWLVVKCMHPRFQIKLSLCHFLPFGLSPFPWMDAILLV